MRKLTMVLTAMVGTMLAAGAAGAQVRGDKCGTLAHPEARLTRLARYFVSPDYAEFRDDIPAIAAADSQAVVTDEHECGPVMRAAVKYLRAQPAWRDLQRDGFDFNVLRYGPYVAVVVLQLPPAGQRLGGGWMRMLIFRASDLALLGVRLV